MGRNIYPVVFSESGGTCMSVAYVFPGQGSQYVGMGKDLYESSALAKSMYDRADDIFQVPFSRICFEGPEEELKQTRNTQPAIFIQSVVLVRLMRNTVPAMAAGHSLGEYSALTAAGALTFEDGLRLVRLRGELMQQAGTEHPGTMAAVIGLDGKTITEICAEASAAGIVQPANFNSPGQVVLSGSVSGVRRAMELSKTRGAKFVKELTVSGAFHSPLMESAAAGLRAGLEKTDFRDASFPVYANVTARPEQKAENIRLLLLEQLTCPVRWEESIQAMAAAGAASFIEIGPGKILQGLVKRTAPAVKTAGRDKFSDIGGEEEGK
jgi:[acyl-carrier-protein] S-malonyltransferase